MPKNKKNLAEQQFIEGWSITPENLDRAGVVVDAALLRKKGEYQLAHGFYTVALDVFTHAGDGDGIRRTLEAVTTVNP